MSANVGKFNLIFSLDAINFLFNLAFLLMGKKMLPVGSGTIMKNGFFGVDMTFLEEECHCWVGI